MDSSEVALAERARRRALLLVEKIGTDLGVDDIVPVLDAVGNTVNELEGLPPEQREDYLLATLDAVLEATTWPVWDWAIDKVIRLIAPGVWRYLGIL